MIVKWVDGFSIAVSEDNGTVTISANREGLQSLAGQLATLADAVPGDHIHYDEFNSLEEGSVEMIIERVLKSLDRNYYVIKKKDCVIAVVETQSRIS